MPSAERAAAPTGPKLMQAVHACRRQVPALQDEAAWRGFLLKTAGKDSLRAMTGRELGRVIDALHAQGAPRRAGTGAGRPASTLDMRPQARMARGIWIELGRAGVVRDRSERALDAFAKRITGRDSLRFCDARQLNQVVEAVKDMRDRASPSISDDLPEPEPRDGETREQAMVRALWDALRHASAMRTGTFANLETWLLKCGYRQRHVENLSPEQAAHAVAKLTTWWRRHRMAAQAGGQP